MRFVTCDGCRNERTPLNASLLVDEKVYCENCLKQKFPSEGDLKGKKVVEQLDPTVCFKCANDSGDVLLKRLGSYPVCSACEQAIEMRVFPGWVKAFFAGVIILVVFSLAWNWRFIDAYYQIKRTSAVLEKGTVAEVAELYSEIADNVSEISEFRQLASYYNGVMLLNADKGAEALDAFRTCTALPDDYGIPVLKLQAEISASFDNKDYLNFADASLRYLSYDTSSVAMAQVASAYACVYAQQKSDSTRLIAMEYLQKAIDARDTTRFFSSYVNRIEHRLATGEIIDRETFEARFPNGWSK